MRLLTWVLLTVCWFAWLYPFLFRAPHFQNRSSITSTWPTLLGLLLEVSAISVALLFRLPEPAGSAVRISGSAILGITACVLSWSAVRHLGRQFRVRAGLYEDHQLVRTGPYAIVRHPIYASLFAMLLSTLVLLTPWQWTLVSVALFVGGTEIRVGTEDRLLESRFQESFRDFRKKIPAYIPFLR